MGEGRPTTIHYRWTAQDAEGAGKTPGVIANPYGVNPDEAFTSTGKPAPDDKRWAKSFKDGDEVDLPVAACRVGWMLEQFFVPGHRWEEVPKDVTAGTIGELCQKLAARGERYAIYRDFASDAPAPATPDAQRAVDERKRAIAKKLVWYWQNTDYRWALLHSGTAPATIDKQPASLATQATGSAGSVSVSGTLTWVLARYDAQPRVASAPNPQGDGAAKKATTLRVRTKPEWSADPAPGTPFADLPADFRETIKRSFVDRMSGAPGAYDNFANAFWGGPMNNAWEGLQRFSPQGVNLLMRLYRRMEAIDASLKLWRQIKYIRNQWWGGSAGVKVVYMDRAAMRVTLDGLFSATATPSVARDRFFYGLEHQRASSFSLAPQAIDSKAELPDCDTWREVDKPRGEACHFCVSKSDLPGHMVTPQVQRDEFFEADGGPRPDSLDDVHIDWFSPVSGVDAGERKCNYLPISDGSATHWFQATMGIGKPTFYFTRIDDKLGGLGDRLTKDARIASFAKEWDGKKWKLALQGKAGDQQAQSDSAQLDKLIGDGGS